MEWKKKRISPQKDAIAHILQAVDKPGLEIKFIDSFKGRGIFSSTNFQCGEFVLEYRGQLLSPTEYRKALDVYDEDQRIFLFEFYFNGKLCWMDAMFFQLGHVSLVVLLPNSCPAPVLPRLSRGQITTVR
ncbi:N-lysine methyltransferase KMT5A-like [Astyanax mexicanus]|uniref:N-lysine methyltransferase KMT5A-like n=1 Tax=Astyanax mexicanus TaxID=7994 RepID=A0A8T2MAU7_ASTMX|nr:N-lysine methyltransferase KMT5A-like [Astyanax mexicanus]